MKQIIIKILIGIVVASCSLHANAQVKAFEKYADMKNVTYVYISKYMLGMAGKGEQSRSGETEERRQRHYIKRQVRVADADERGRQQGEHLPLYRQTAVGRSHADRRQR